MGKYVRTLLCLFFLALAAVCLLYAQLCFSEGLRDFAWIMVGFGTLAFVLATGLPVVLTYLNKRPPGACPFCSGAVIRKPGFFQAMPLERCPTCGQEWEPDAPTWFLLAGVVIGLLALALGVLGGSWIQRAMLLAGGSMALQGCLTRLARKRKT